MEEDTRRNAHRMVARAALKLDVDRAIGTPAPPPPGPLSDYTSVVVNGVPRDTHTRLQQLAFRSNLSLSQLGLLGLELLLHRADDGGPMDLPIWGKHTPDC